jgi:hypothetical protein
VHEPQKGQGELEAHELLQVRQRRTQELSVLSGVYYYSGHLASYRGGLNGLLGRAREEGIRTGHRGLRGGTGAEAGAEVQSIKDRTEGEVLVIKKISQGPIRDIFAIKTNILYSLF